MLGKKNVDKNNTITEKNTNACIELGCDAGTKYVGSKNSDKFYTCDCYYADRIKPENIVCFTSKQEAEADGRTESEC